MRAGSGGLGALQDNSSRCGVSYLWCGKCHQLFVWQPVGKLHALIQHRPLLDLVKAMELDRHLGRGGRTRTHIQVCEPESCGRARPRATMEEWAVATSPLRVIYNAMPV